MPDQETKNAQITPGGLCSCVSPAFGDSTSDRQIVERSTMPQDCDRGDSVIADKGLTWKTYSQQRMSGKSGL